ncbi:MAG: type III-A CRISPR-associated RAMP protein Csm3 [Candidatus Woesearchaeota archaeon]
MEENEKNFENFKNMEDMYVILEYDIEVLTGLHIGTSRDSISIGGVDNPIIKDKYGFPYIPGSSLKGKIRSLLEKANKIKDLAEFNENTYNHIESKIAFIFGSPGQNRKTPIAVIFRDAKLLLDDSKNHDPKEFIEIKFENKINRIDGTAKDPREIERVVPKTKFRWEIVIKRYLFTKNGDEEEFVYKERENSSNVFRITLKEVEEIINQGIKLLENDYLGGSGTRGYGKVRFIPIYK